jgi:peptidoglycan/xylan/chitin deacetylase (PgdA/CDA1 family)
VADIRAKLAGIDRAALPTVEQTREALRAPKAEKDTPAPIWDRDQPAVFFPAGRQGAPRRKAATATAATARAGTGIIASRGGTRHLPGDKQERNRPGLIKALKEQFRALAETLVSTPAPQPAGRRRRRAGETRGGLLIPARRFIRHMLHGQFRRAAKTVFEEAPPRAYAAAAAYLSESFDFDDGFQSGYDFGLPLFDAAGWKVTECIITKRFGARGYVTQAEVQDENRRGHEMCAHTRTHQDLALLTQAQQSDEILGSKADLEALVGHTVVSFAYPFGHHNNSAVGYAMIAGFQNATTVYGTTGTSTYDNGTTANTNPFIIGRYPMISTTSMSYSHAIVDYAISHNVWVVFLFHSVDDPTSSISVRHQFIQDLISYVQSKGRAIQVVTTSQGIATLGLQQLQK